MALFIYSLSERLVLLVSFQWNQWMYFQVVFMNGWNIMMLGSRMNITDKFCLLGTIQDAEVEK